MRSFHHSVLAGTVAIGLGGGAMLMQSASFAGTPQIQRLGEEHWKYPHMHHAMASLREARTALDDAEDVFHGHKQDAIDHVEMAIKAIEKGLKEQNDESALPSELPQPSKLDEHFPHVHVALERLKDARTELDAADKVFAGHRDEAISQTDKAIKQLDDAIHDAG